MKSKTQRGKRRLNIAITNDDGYDAGGLQALAETLETAGHAVTVVAPQHGVSACSRSLTMRRPLSCMKLAPRRYIVDGTPTDCAMVAIYQIFKNKKPDLFLSGINHGRNLGDDVTYSGTCAGAFEPAMVGIPSAALSALADSNGVWHMQDAAEFFVERLLPDVMRLKLPRWCMLNINFPGRPKRKIRGYKVTPLGRSTYLNPIVTSTSPRDGSRIYWIAGKPKTERRRGTDIEAVERGFAAVSPVHLDLNDPKLLKTCRAAFNGTK